MSAPHETQGHTPSPPRTGRLHALIAVSLTLAFLLTPTLHAQNTHRASLVRAQSQYFSAPDSASLSITGDLTIEAWVKDQTPFASSETRAILTKLELTGTGSFRSYSFKRTKDSGGTKQLTVAISVTGFNDTELSLAYPFDDSGAWTHYAAVYTAASGRADLLVNGVNIGNLTGFPTSISDSNVPLKIGASFNGGETHNGSIDDVRLWAVARTHDQIRATMFTELAGTETGLKGYWKLNNSLADSSANGNMLTFHDTSLKAHYHLEDTADSSGNGYHLSNNGGVAFNPARFGNGADLGSANSSKHLAAADDLGGSLFSGSSSWSVWFKPTAQPSLNGQYEVLGMATYSGSIERDYQIRYCDVAGIKRLEWIRGNYGGTDTTLIHNISLPLETWHHLALVYDAATNIVSGYLDGVRVSSGIAYNNPSGGGSNKKLTIGAWVTPTYFASGTIDEAAVFARALEANEIAFLSTQAYSGGAFAFYSNDLPFSSSSNQLEWCPQNGLVALYRLEDTSDSSGGGNPLTNNNGAVFAAGKFGNGVMLNGSNQWLGKATPTGLPTGAAARTVSLWYKLTSVSGCYLLDYGTANVNQHFAVKIDDATHYSVDLGSVASAVTIPTPLIAGVWHNVVVSYSGAGSGFSVYHDGVLLGTLNLGNPSTGSTFLSLGSYNNSTQFGVMNGSLDEVAIFDRALSAEEIMKYYGGIVSARFAALAGDGAVLNIGGTDWVARRNGSAGTTVYGGDTSTQGGVAGNRGNSGADFVERGFFPVDTSALPNSGIQLSRAALKIHIPSNGFTVCPFYVTPQTQANVNALSAGDFSAVTLDNSPTFSALQTTAVLGALNSVELNSAGVNFISLTGPTKLGTRSSYDVNTSGENLAEENTAVTFSESATNKPFLLVEYAASVAANYSVSGSIIATNPPAGMIRITASSTTTGASGSTTVAAPGAYSIGSLPPGQSYIITAYLDEDGDNVKDPIEWTGDYAGNPLLVDGNKTGIDITLINPFSIDTDNDGLPDAWEIANGLTVGVNDAAFDKDGDGLSNAQELWLGLGANNTDSDNDGLSDFAEVNIWGTNPLLADSDSDGLPDKWETDNGLDPRRDDADEDSDFDFVNNRDEYNGGTNPTKANSGDSDNDGVSDYVQAHGGQSTWQAIYDRNDRLLGTRDARGASFAHRYDGNGNPIKQAKLGFDSDGDGLSDLWEFANGLDPNSPNGNNGKAGDADGDGWTNLQEQIAGSDPNDANSRPGANGSVIGALSVPFTPTNFISASGQLDNAGSEEFVAAADGNPGAQTNFIRLFKESGGSWTDEQVSVGSYGVTSATIGQFPTRRPAVYLGLRKTGGTGRVVELVKDDLGVWQTNVVAESTSDAAYVTGFRTTATGTDLIFTAATRIGPDGGLYRAVYESGTWKQGLLDLETTHPSSSNPLSAATRGTGTISKSPNIEGTDRVVRLLDVGGIQVASPRVFPSVDEFNDTTLAPLWSFNGTMSNNGSWSVTESGGLARVQANWTSINSGSAASAYLETTNLWGNGNNAILVSIPSIGHSTGPSPSLGNASVLLGNTTLYTIGPRQSASNVFIHLIRVGSFIYYRLRVDAAAWSNWSQCPDSGTLRFQANGSRGTSTDGAGGANVHIDYVRHLSTGQIVSSVAATSDFTNSEATYSSASNTWYFKTPSAQTWLNSQLYAFARGGNLVTIDSANTNSWLQGKFSGEFWMGYYRDFATSPWKWIGGSTATFTPAPGQPGGGVDQFFAFSSGGTWSPASATDTRAGVFEVKQPLVEVSSVVEPEPAATHRLQWTDQTLTTGRFNPSTAAQTSVIEAFIDDKDGSNTATAGDEFVIAEYVLDSSPAQVRTLSRRTLPAGNLAAGYGFAAIRSRSGTSDFLVTGENDGQVFAWLPATPGTALQRKTLSTEHVGKAWHSLERVPMAGGADALIGLRVTSGAPQTANVVFWSAYDLGFSAPPIIQQSAPSAQIAATPASGLTHARVDVRLWDSEGNPSRVALQYQQPPGTGTWTDATLLTIAGQPAAANPALTATPTGSTHILIWNAGQNLGAAFNGGVLLRARATDSAAIGEWSTPIFYSVDTTQDTDGDGIPNAWESANGLNPNLADAFTDSDNDGLKALMEFALGLNPQSASLVGTPSIFIGNAAGAVATPSETGFLTIQITRNAAASALDFRVKVSSDLATWLYGSDHVTVLQDTPTFLKVRDNTPVSAQGQRFIRLEVIAP